MVINGSKSETLVIDKDSTGQLWISWIEDRKVKVNRSTTNDLTWGEPFTLPVQGGNTGSENDISSVVAFGGGKIGVMWSNQSAEANYFAVHNDADPDNISQPRETALEDNSLGAVADNHINLKAACDSTGAVYAAAKTSLGGNDPLVYLLKRDSTGVWSKTICGYGQEGHTRPVVLIDHENDLLYVFATSDRGNSGKDAIYMKVTDINNISFSSGLGIPVIESGDNNGINNVTSTKQCIDSATGFLVLASDHIAREYFHNYLGPGEVKPVIFSFSPSGGLEGTSVTIRGLNFTGTLAVSFNSVPATNFSIISDNEIQATVPAGSSTGPISITNAEGTNISVNDFAIGAPPVLETLSDVTMDEGDVLNVAISASTSGNSDINLTIENLPDFGSFTDGGDGSGNIRFTPTFDDMGLYPDIKIIATNDDNALLFDETSFLLTVNNINRPPELTTINHQQIAEGGTLDISLSATDPDDDEITLSAENLPDFANFNDDGNGSGTIRFLPGFEDAGDYTNIRITAEDDGNPSLSETIEFTVTIDEKNRAPEIAIISDQEMEEGDSLEVAISATDADGDDIIFAVNNLPEFGNLTDNGDGSGTIIFLPLYDHSAFYGNIEVIAEDNSDPAAADTFHFSVMVENVNRAPEIGAISPQAIPEGDILTVSLSASDLDGDSLSFTANNLPLFGTITNLENGNGSIVLSPTLHDSGVYQNIKVIVTDHGSAPLSDTTAFVLTVSNRNQAPIAQNDTLAIEEDAQVTFTVLPNDSDPDGDPLIIFAVLPPHIGVAAIDPGDTTITYSPTPDSSGTDIFQYIVKDGSGSMDTAEVIITIDPVNDWPVVEGLPDSLTFPADASGTINIWEAVYDVESSDEMRYTFSALPDTFNLGYDDALGLLHISPKNAVDRSSADLVITITDPDAQSASVADTIRIIAESIVGINDPAGIILPANYTLLAELSQSI